VIGVFDASLTEKLAEVLKLVGVETAYVVHGLDGLDEISTVGETKVSELRDGQIKTYNISPSDFGIKSAKMDDIKGGSPEDNAKIVRDILSQKEKGAKRAIVVLNAAAAIAVSGIADDIKSAIPIANEAIDSGNALKKLEALIEYSQK